MSMRIDICSLKSEVAPSEDSFNGMCLYCIRGYIAVGKIRVFWNHLKSRGVEFAIRWSNFVIYRTFSKKCRFLF